MATVRLCDARVVKFCNKGGRAFAERHGLDWAEFLKNGLDESMFLATGDAMALKAVAAARKRESE